MCPTILYPENSRVYILERLWYTQSVRQITPSPLYIFWLDNPLMESAAERWDRDGKKKKNGKSDNTLWY